jgi:hypothetical protein
MHGVKFAGHAELHTKYCLLLEGYVDGKRDVVGAYGTSSLEYHFLLSSFVIPCHALGEEPLEDTLIQLDNYAFLTRQRLFERQTHYIGQLTDDLHRQLDDALEHLHVDPVIWLRMCG